VFSRIRFFVLSIIVIPSNETNVQNEGQRFKAELQRDSQNPDIEVISRLFLQLGPTDDRELKMRQLEWFLES